MLMPAHWDRVHTSTTVCIKMGGVQPSRSLGRGGDSKPSREDVRTWDGGRGGGERFGRRVQQAVLQAMTMTSLFFCYFIHFENRDKFGHEQQKEEKINTKDETRRFKSR